MRRWVFLFLTVCGVCLTSCLTDDDGYSLDDVWVSLGIVDKEENDSYTVQLDDGAVLYPAVSNVQGWMLEDSGRVMVTYTILSDKLITDTRKEYYVKIISVSEVLKKGIIDITPAIEDSIGNDPVIIEKAWVSKNQLLNFRFRYYGAVKVHYINLVKEPGVLMQENLPVALEFRHNDNGDRQDYSLTGLVSFDLKAIQMPGIDSVRFEVSSRDFDGQTHLFEGVYHY